MHELDKAAMGQRIRQIRLGAQLRQWELAQILGTTQSAIHKYEHGVVPESRRLLEIARIGETTLEWVLTGRHWSRGSERQQRIPDPVLDTAQVLTELGEVGQGKIDEALRIVQDAVRAVTRPEDAPAAPTAPSVRAALSEQGEATVSLLETAWRIQRSVLSRATREAERRLSDFAVEASPASGGDD